MGMYDYEKVLLSQLENIKAQLLARPLTLGGYSGANGGSGGPSGGFIGFLPQTRVAYDLSENATLTLSGELSLVDNLNRIRYRLSVVESGVFQVADTDTINLSLASQVLTADLKTTSVTSGTYTNANITVDSYGRITGASNGGTTGSGIASLPSGLVYGPSSSSAIDGHLAVFDGNTGKLLKDGGGTTLGYQTLQDGSTINWNLSLGSGGVTLAGNRTLANPTNQVGGGTYYLLVTQDSTGSRQLAYGNCYRFSGGGVLPVLSTGAGKVDLLTFCSDGTRMFCTNIVKDFAAAPAFDPLTLSGLAMWIKADSLSLTNGDAVSSWSDLSTAGNHISATSSVRPIFTTNQVGGKPAVVFDGVDDVMRMAVDYSINGIRTVFMVVSSTATGVRCALGHSFSYHFYPDSTGWYSSSYASDFVKSGSFRYNGVLKNTTSDARLSGYTIVSLVTTGDVEADLFGCDRFMHYWQGGLAEMLVCTSPLSNTEINNTLTYLSGKYGIAVTLL